jgi:hypothetical protein
LVGVGQGISLLDEHHGCLLCLEENIFYEIDFMITLWLFGECAI